MLKNPQYNALKITAFLAVVLVAGLFTFGHARVGNQAGPGIDSVDLKVNNSDNPTAVNYGQPVTVTWTATSSLGYKVTCTPGGATALLTSSAGLWSQMGAQAPIGSVKVLARDQSGYLANLSFSIICHPSTGTDWTDQVTLPVNAETAAQTLLLGGGDFNGTDLNDVWSLNQGNGIWTQITASASWPGRRFFPSLFFNNKLWVIGGGTGPGSLKNDVWSSSDGATWTQVTANAPWNPRVDFGSVVFQNKIFVMGGANNTVSGLADVWSSPDGATWTQVTANAPWKGRHSFQSLVFNNKIWIISGNVNYEPYGLNDVWSSPDGATWTQVTANAPWRARSGFKSVVFNNKMYIIGGLATIGSQPYLSDVWSSPDGATWTQVTVNAPWGTRYSYQATTFGNKIWIMGGVNGPLVNDVWSSSDGATWTQVTANAPWNPRQGASLASLPSSPSYPNGCKRIATKPVTQITQTSAVLNGCYASEGLTTTTLFRYGTNPTPGTSPRTSQVTQGFNDGPVSYLVTGLKPNTTYYYRTLSNNANGNKLGSILSFTTLP